MIVSVVGKSGSGKTHLIEKLVPILKNHGLRVVVVKHAKKNFEIDKEGKDSYRIFAAGADVAILSPSKFALIKRVKSDDLPQFMHHFADYDVIITEGFSDFEFPKIVVGDGEYSNVLARIKRGFGDEDVDRIAKMILAGVRDGSKERP